MSKNPFFGKDQEKAANKAFTPQQLDQMRAMLDDPNVSNENKKNFLYVLSDAGRLSDDEVGKYSQQVGANPGDVFMGGKNLNENFKNAQKSMGAAAEDKRNAEVQANEQAIAATAKEDRGREEQFRREVAAAHEDPDPPEHRAPPAHQMSSQRIQSVLGQPNPPALRRL